MRAYQMYRYLHTPSAWVLALTILDLALIYLTWDQYMEQKELRSTRKESYFSKRRTGISGSLAARASGSTRITGSLDGHQPHRDG
jgi:hypothetical protein